jgi:anti-sigma B factor antagonist
MEIRTGEATPDPAVPPGTGVTPLPTERQTLTVSSRPTLEGVRVDVSGDLDFETAGTLRDLLHTVVLRSGQRLAVDLGAVDFFDSSGLGALLAARSLAHESGAVLELLAPPDHILRVLDAVGLSSYFDAPPAPQP